MPDDSVGENCFTTARHKAALPATHCLRPFNYQLHGRASSYASSGDGGGGRDNKIYMLGLIRMDDIPVPH